MPPVHPIPEPDWLARFDRSFPESLRGLIDGPFARSCVLYEEYVHRLARGVCREIGLDDALRRPATADELMRATGCVPSIARVPFAWLLAEMVRGGAIERSGTQFRADRPIAILDPSEVEQAQMELEPSWQPSYALAKAAAHGYPEFLRGRQTGEEILFSPARASLWSRYFSNANGLYGVNNRVAAHALLRAMTGRPPAHDGPLAGPHAGARDPRPSLLELGGGLGSAAQALVAQVGPDAFARYRFTDLVPAFLRSAQRTLAQGGPSGLEFGKLDIDRPFAPQGVAPGTCDIVYAVNTVHVARDLGFTLEQIHETLSPHGLLVLGECVRPFPERVTYVEFVFNLIAAFRDPLLDPEFRPQPGFLTPEQWIAALSRFGFREITFYPEIRELRHDFPDLLVTAIVAVKS